MSISDVNNNAIMVNGLWMNVDPRGEIRRITYWHEKIKKLNERETYIKSYYSEADKENRSFESPYNHILNKYKFPDSPYYRSDMTEKERETAFYQETALLRGDHMQLNDSYALAADGGMEDIEKACDQAVQAALAKKKEEMIAEYGGESTYETYMQKIQVTFNALLQTANIQEMCHLEL